MQANQRSNTPQGIVLLFVPVFIMLGAVLIAPIMGMMFQHFSTTPYFQVLVPLLLTAPALCLAIFSPIAGGICNRIGAKKLLVFSLGLYGFMGVAPVFLESLYAILASRIIMGIAEAGIITAGMVLISLYFTGDRRQKWISYQNIALPLIGALLLYVVGIVSAIKWQYTFGLYGLSFLVFIAAALFLYEPAQQTQAIANNPPAEKKSKISLQVIGLICLIAIPGSIGFYAVPIKLAFLLEAIGYPSPAVVGEVLSYGLIIGAPSGAILARFIKHWRFGTTLALAMTIMGAGLVTAALASDKTTVIIGVVIQQAGGGLMLTAALTFVLFIAPKGQTGTYSGLWWFVYTLANFATPLVLSGIDVFTPSSNVTMIAVGAFSIGMAFWLMRPPALKAQMSSESV
ncbi:MFS transporter [Paraglaciecola sp.]|uniref:MFS transporter n=1 Tax=Paraglaciecola sp. TaxID=1920173 RepID=UPI00273E326A|nr:MFS transporter [Paraglaciecola sp.]MDP5033055.1 MFS transporter [Paraglaciecola sp.]